MADLLATLIGGGVGVLWLTGFITFIALAYWLPVMALRAMRDIRRIREQFERLNDILERQGSYPIVSRPNGPEDQAPTSGPQYYTRTGPLGRM